MTLFSPKNSNWSSIVKHAFPTLCWIRSPSDVQKDGCFGKKKLGMLLQNALTLGPNVRSFFKLSNFIAHIVI